MKEPEERKMCINCANYIRHYVLAVGGKKFIEIDCGHCAKDTRRKRLSSKAGCDKWENCEVIKERRKESIENTLTQMMNKIRDIAQVVEFFKEREER